jgi:magnesium-transporting ATPase (P-type)
VLNFTTKLTLMRNTQDNNSNRHSALDVVVQAKRIHDVIEHTASMDIKNKDYITNTKSNINNINTNSSIQPVLSLSSSTSSSISTVKNRKKSTRKYKQTSLNNTNHTIKESKPKTVDKSSNNNTSKVSPYDTNVHRLTVDELESIFHTDIENGLDLEYYEHLLEKHGPNELTPIEKESNLIKLLKHLFSGVFNILLWISSLLQIGMYFILTDKNCSNCNDISY